VTPKPLTRHPQSDTSIGSSPAPVTVVALWYVSAHAKQANKRGGGVDSKRAGRGAQPFDCLADDGHSNLGQVHARATPRTCQSTPFVVCMRLYSLVCSHRAVRAARRLSNWCTNKRLPAGAHKTQMKLRLFSGVSSCCQSGAIQPSQTPLAFSRARGGWKASSLSAAAAVHHPRNAKVFHAQCTGKHAMRCAAQMHMRVWAAMRRRLCRTTKAQGCSQHAHAPKSVVRVCVHVCV